MKKIININLSGRVIPIEDSAYEKLQNYIESLRRYFAQEEGRDEIINDIESRIAELMNEKVRKGAAAITDADVEEIVAAMGRVEDFEAAEKETAAGTAASSQQQSTSDTTETYTIKERRRLYRDRSDKIIGGVCSGIANYLNIDPAIIRILFAIISFGGFGLGFLIYIILWIVLPPRDLEGFSGKRLYRNPDDKIIGGVAGGLAAYFNRSVSTTRLIFAAPIILSIIIGVIRNISWHYHSGYAWNIGFGSLSGTFILAYIILWIVLPEANSEYQKMEMRGEKVDINRIRQNVKEGMDSMKEKMKGWGEEVKTSAQNLGSKAKEFASTRGKAFAAEFNETARRGGHGLGHAIAVLFKVFFLVIAGTIAFGLFVAFIALLFGGVAWWPVNDFLWTSKWQQTYAWGTLIFFLGVPVIGFIIWVVRRILRVRSRSNYLGWTFGTLWVLGWVVAVFFAASMAKDFRYYEHTENGVAITQPARGKMIVAVSQPALEYQGNFAWMNEEGHGRGWNISTDTLKLSTIKFNVKASTDSIYHVWLKKYSFGRDEQQAFNRAEKIQYAVLYRDSVLDLGSGYAIYKDNKFRGQQVEIEIQVPAGKKIRFDESVKEKLNPVNFIVKRKNRRREVVDIDFDNGGSFHFRTGVDYIMGIDGDLKDAEGNTVEKKNENYKYQPNDSQEIEKSIEKKKQELKDLEDKKKALQGKPNTSVNNKKKSTTDESLATAPSPVSSLTQWF